MVLLVGPTLAGPLEMRWPMNGTSRDMRRFDSEMDELSEANKSRPCFSLSYVLRIRRMSCDIARFRST